MIKNIKTKLTIFILLVAMFLTMGHGVYAKDLKYKAVLNENNGKYTIRLMTVVRSVLNEQQAKEESKKYGKTLGEWLEVSTENKKKPSGSSGSYDEYAIIFHQEYLSKYNDTWADYNFEYEKTKMSNNLWSPTDNFPGINVYYDVYKSLNKTSNVDIIEIEKTSDGKLQINSEDFWNGLTGKKANVTQKIDNDYQIDSIISDGKNRSEVPSGALILQRTISIKI